MFIACDESGTDGSNNKFVIGSLSMPKNTVGDYEKAITNLRIKYGVWGEIKWSKISPQYIDFYKEFLKISIIDFSANYRCIVIDKSQVDYTGFHGGDKMLAFFKFYKLLLQFNIKQYLKHSDDSFQIIIDNIEGCQKYLPDCRKYLENNCGKVIERLCPCSSHICSLTQSVDLITGAISAIHNKQALSGCKKELKEYAEKLLKGDFGVATLPSAEKFNLWIWRPAKI